MSERFYRQQMEHFNIKSVAELGQFHRGEITKRGKRSAAPTKGVVIEKKRAILKADLMGMINAFFTEPLTTNDYKSLTGTQLSDLLVAVTFKSEDNPDELKNHTMPSGRLKKPYCEDVRNLLGIPNSYELDITKMTLVSLKKLIIQLSTGIMTNEQ